MKKINSSFKAIAAFILLVCSTSAYAQNKMVAYVPNWINLNTYSNNIPYSKLTHINIAFENPVNSAGDLSFNSQNNVLINKAHANNVKVLISIGGGSASGDQTLLARYAMLTNNANRAAFVAKISAYVTAHNFDGLDVDLEGPNINGDYGAFIAALSGALKPKGKLLTSALSQGYGGGNVPNSVFQYMDFINIMAYDGKGYWNPNDPGNHSTLDYAKSNTQYWLNRGLPKEKAVLGVPFYGYGFGNAFRNRDYPYNEIVNTYPGAETKDQVGSTIWYNGIPTIKAKTNYAFDIKIGGMMIWSLDYDGTGAKSLLSAMDEVFKQRSVVVPPIPQGPYNGVRINLPGKLEVENYDVGGQDVAYNDLTADNSGAVYRTDGVDIQATTDTDGGYNLGWVEAGEWLEYSVNVAAAGVYKLDIRSASTAGAIRVEVDGVDATGSIALPNTGAYQTWATTTKTGVSLPAGQHILRIVVLTGGFNLNYITFSNAPNQLPTVSLTSPLDNASFTAPASVTINATAADADGTVSKVDFYNGSTLLSSDATAPYSFVWTNVVAGTYAITARATDNTNAVVTSSAVNITVVPPVPLCLPVSASGDDGNIPANVLDNNTATRWSANGDGQWIQFCQGSPITMSGVQIAFYSGNVRQSIFDVQVSQNGSDWSNVLTNVRSSGTSLALENFTFTAQSAKYLRVVGHGNTVNTWNSYTEVKILTGETPVNQLPTVAITSPANNASFNTPASITINASASDADGSVTKVEFYNGSTLLGTDATAPYSFSWTSVAAGTYTITAIATDNAGATKTATAVSVTVVNTPLAIKEYTINKTLTAITVDGVLNESGWVNAPATDNLLNMNGTAAVQATSAKMLWSDTHLYFAFTIQDNSIWSTLTARDAQLWTQDVLEVLIDKDGDGVNYTEIGFGPNGSIYDLVMDKPYSTGGAPNTAWNIANLQVKTTVTGTINSATGGVQWVVEAALPFAGIPATPATFGKPNAGDSWRLNIARADHNYNTATGEKLYTWTYTDGITNHLPSRFGKVTFAAPVGTPPNQAPLISLTSPSNTTTLNAPATVVIAATASDADGTISKVDFYSGSTLLFSDLSAPYGYNWTSVAAGTYSITARATDNNGATTTTAAVSVRVNAVVNNTCSAIAQYVENGNYVAGSKVKNGNSQYQCKPYPYSGWCNGSAWAYAPGAGAYWADAWTLVGSCSSARTSEDAASAMTTISNAPNPFVSTTDVQVVVAEAGEVSVLVYNKEGQVVGTVVEGYLTAGTHTFTFDAAALKSDLYLIKYHSASGVATQKMLKVQ